jgi:transposase-like protein
MPPTGRTFPLYDRILDGELTALLVDWRAEGHSYDEITDRLREMGVQASRSTVNRWCKDLGIAS